MKEPCALRDRGRGLSWRQRRQRARAYRARSVCTARWRPLSLRPCSARPLV